MATKKQKRLAGIAKREKFEAEQRERGQHFLRLAQAERAAERAKAEEARKERAKKRSQQLAAAHRAKQAAEQSKPGQHKTVAPVSQNKRGASGRRKKYQKAREGKKQHISPAAREEIRKILPAQEA